MSTFTETLLAVTYETTSCPSCGARFAMDKSVLDEKRRLGTAFYCPNGHSLSFNPTEVQRLRDEKARLTSQLDQERAARRQAQENAERAEKAAARAKRKVARAHKGVCTECNRSFTSLARHMKAKHGK